MRENKEKAEKKRKRFDEKIRQRAEAEVAAGPVMQAAVAVAEITEEEKDLEKAGL